MDDYNVVKLQSSACATCAIRHRAVCGALKDRELATLSRMGRFKRYSTGEMILADGEPTTFFANIVSGVVRLDKTSADGRQQTVGLLFAPDFLGRAYADHNPYFAHAACDVMVCQFPHEAFERLMHHNNGLEHRMFQKTLNELDAARDWMFLLGRKTAKEKVATLVHMIASRHSHIGCTPQIGLHEAQFQLPLTRADMAMFLGLTIETVSRQLSALNKAGTIRLISGREVAVPDLSTLALTAGLDDIAAA